MAEQRNACGELREEGLRSTGPLEDSQVPGSVWNPITSESWLLGAQHKSNALEDTQLVVKMDWKEKGKPGHDYSYLGLRSANSLD